MLLKRLSQSLLLLGPIALLPGCFDSDKKDKTPPSKFSLAVTDAPIDGASAVLVEFHSVVLQPSDRERIEIRLEQPMRIDLLALQGQKSQYLVLDKEIPAGDYDWIRLGVNANLDGVMDSYIELDNGSQLELTIPSDAEAGLKLTQGFVLSEGGDVNFTIDFDLRRSIWMPANSSTASAVFVPSLRRVDSAFAGSIEGEIDELIISEYCQDPEDFGAVYVFDHSVVPDDVAADGQGPIASAIVGNSEGRYHYEVGFLPSGNYRVAYTCEASLDTPELDEDITFIEPGPNAITLNLMENLVVDFVEGEGAEEAPKPEPTAPVDEPDMPGEEPEAPAEEPEAPAENPDTPVDAETPPAEQTPDQPVIEAPDLDPTLPDETDPDLPQPELPDLDPALPDLDPALPDLEPTVPDLEPTLPDVGGEAPEPDTDTPAPPGTDEPDIELPDADGDTPVIETPEPDVDPVIPDLDPVIPDLDPLVPDLDPLVPDLDPLIPEPAPQEPEPETPAETPSTPAEPSNGNGNGMPEEPGKSADKGKGGPKQETDETDDESDEDEADD